MKTSPQGEKALELEEGVVLRAYRDVVGVWTIGPGLTAKSGVVTPKAGMVITPEEATALLRAALPKYEARVAAAMPGAAQHEFDAAVSFDWNTGAIDHAKWVVFWRAKAGAASIRNALMMWCRAGGRVLPGLEARRAREARMLLDGVYRSDATPAKTPFAYADWGIRLSREEIAAAIKGFQDLGYDVGRQPGAILRYSVRKFQSDYDLTADGIIGRATLSTLQRQLDARAKVKTAAAAIVAPVAAVALPAGTVELVDQLMALPHAPSALIGLGLAYAVAKAFHYRDAVAASPFTPAPLAAILRSF